MQRLLLPGALLALAACPTQPVTDGGAKLPPQVFLTVNDSNVIDTTISGHVSVSGCKNVTQVQMLQGGSFLADLNYTTNPTAWTLPASSFAPLYNHLGIAADLVLSAKVVCDDGRTNTSQPVSVSFFPVVSHLSTGNQLLPDTFTATGGLGGTPVSFTGCIGTPQGATALASYDSQGNQALINIALPFTCSSALVISPRSKSSGIRWMMEPGVGAMAVDDTLTIKKAIIGNLKRMGVSSTGTGIFWQDSSTTSMLLKVEPVASSTNDWHYANIVGIMNSDPVVDVGNRLVWATMWTNYPGTVVDTTIGDIVVYEFNLDNGVLANDIVSGGISQGPPVLIRQTYGNPVNKPIIPQGSFNTDGTLFYAPLLSQDNATVVHTTILACSTAGTCTDNARKWTSQTFDGVVNLVLPFSAGNYLAGVGPYQVWFLSAQTGTVVNLGESAIRPTGSLQVLGVQPGVNADLYVLDGPVIPNAYPIEAVAIDKPERGELWRFTFGSGESSNAGITLAVDDTGQTWFRLGPDIVKPLPLAEYRQARGATPLP